MFVTKGPVDVMIGLGNGLVPNRYQAITSVSVHHII